MKLVICIPVRGAVDPMSFMGLNGACMGAVNYWTKEVGGTVDLLVLPHLHDIAQARNQLIQGALDMDADWIFWMDSHRRRPVPWKSWAAAVRLTRLLTISSAPNCPAGSAL